MEILIYAVRGISGQHNPELQQLISEEKQNKIISVHIVLSQ